MEAPALFAVALGVMSYTHFCNYVLQNIWTLRLLITLHYKTEIRRGSLFVRMLVTEQRYLQFKAVEFLLNKHICLWPLQSVL